MEKLLTMLRAATMDAAAENRKKAIIASNAKTPSAAAATAAASTGTGNGTASVDERRAHSQSHQGMYTSLLACMHACLLVY